MTFAKSAEGPKRNLSCLLPLRLQSAIGMFQDNDLKMTFDDERSWLDVAALAYLSLPLSIAAVSWTFPLLGVPFAALVIWAILPRHNKKVSLNIGLVFCLFLLAAVVVCLSGTSPVVGSVPFLDLAKHRWIYNDLVQRSWPVVYDNGALVLRYSLGYYITPALVSKAWGTTSEAMLLAWAAIGVWLFAMMIAERSRLSWLAPVVVLMVLFFGGLDVMGIPTHEQPRTGLSFLEFREDWSFYPYGWIIPSNGFALSWSPQHAIAGWLGGAILYRNWRGKWFYQRCVAIFCALAFWSPFAAVSFAAVVSVLALYRMRSDLRLGDLFTARNLVSVALIGLLAAYYLMGKGVGRYAFLAGDIAEFFPQYCLFVLIEFLAFTVLIAAARITEMPAVIAASAILLIYPWFYIGAAADDLVMSGSRILMTIIALGIVDALQSPGRKGVRFVLASLVCIGLYTGVGEVARLLVAPRTEGRWTDPITALDPNYVGQYVAPMSPAARWAFGL